VTRIYGVPELSYMGVQVMLGSACWVCGKVRAVCTEWVGGSTGWVGGAGCGARSWSKVVVRVVCVKREVCVTRVNGCKCCAGSGLTRASPYRRARKRTCQGAELPNGCCTQGAFVAYIVG